MSIPPVEFTPEMIAADYVLLGRGGTFRVTDSFHGFRWYNGVWAEGSMLGGMMWDVIYAAPRNSEIARLNGHGTVEPATQADSSDDPEADFGGMQKEIAQLREENERLKGELRTTEKHRVELREALENILKNAQEIKPYKHKNDAPGHCHSVKGHWDLDGAPCAWCQAWIKARETLDKTKP